MTNRSSLMMVRAALVSFSVAAAVLVGWSACLPSEPAIVAIDGGMGSLHPPDGGTEAGVLPMRKCDVNKPFLNPRRIDDNVPGDKRGARLSRDELVMYYALAKSEEGGRHRHPWHLMTAKRDAIGDTFKEGSELENIGQCYWGQEFPTITSDGMRVIFSAIAQDGASQELLYFAKRGDSPCKGGVGDPSKFGKPEKLPQSVNLYRSSLHPFLYELFDGGRELWFSSGPEGGGSLELYRMRITGDDWAADASFTERERVLTLTANDEDIAPVLSADGLEIFWAAQRGSDPDGDGIPTDIWTAQRIDSGQHFTNPRLVGELSTPLFEGPSWLSPDGCRLYYFASTDADASFRRMTDLFVAERSPSP
ncbi:hypothetical protein [Pendulispora albinea]|uniref:Uncharacterized protein n=1 Tax=Pendulispora albinea TaxID=2741071 RepID=A0ABZ2LWE7_9BACT